MYHVHCDEDGVRLDVAPPVGQPWQASIRWSSITRVCVKVEDLWIKDLHVYSSDHTERYTIPSQADGAAAIWSELERRGLIGSDFVALAMSAEKGVHCWPPDVTRAEGGLPVRRKANIEGKG